MDTVFISSAQRDCGDVRSAVAAAVEAMGIRPLMAERAAASPHSPKGALLALARSADATILIIGPRYGDAEEGETSPTEDEFNEARAAGRPVLVLVQEIEREPAQEAFLARVRGGWSDGLFSSSFRDASDAGMRAVAALRQLEQAGSGEQNRGVAEQRARELAAGSQHHGFSASGATARVAIVPLSSARILDDLELNQSGLGEQIIGLARASQLIPQRLGAEPQVSSSAGVVIQAGVPHSADSVSLTLDRQGGVIIEAGVAGGGPFGSMLIEPDRLATVLCRTAAFAEMAWSHFDTSQRIIQACLAVGVPGAQNRVYGRASGSSISMGGLASLPNPVVVPEPPLLVRRADIGSTQTVERITAAVERIFRDAGSTSGI